MMKKWIRIEATDLIIMDNIIKDLICDKAIPVDQTMKLCHINEILAGIWMGFENPRKDTMTYTAESKIDGKTIKGNLVIEGLESWIVTDTGSTAVWPDSIEEVQEDE